MELNWKNKDKVILSESDELGIPIRNVWVDRNNQQLIKIYKLNLLKSYGDPNENNMLIFGDSLFALKALENKFENELNKNRIKCIYIDPPYNTGYKFNTYNDIFEHSEWLGMISERLKLMHRLLMDDGIIFVQLDDKEHAFLDILIASIFGEKNKIGTIIWRRRQSQANLSATVSTIHDYIVVYAKNKDFLNNPKLKSMLWTDTKKYGYNQQGSNEIQSYFGEKTAFPTPKPEILLYNILKIATKKNDLVLDCFLGSGTTAAVAHKMGRRWIGIELSKAGFALSKERMEYIISSNKKHNIGISDLVRWRGGGGFKTYEF